MIVSAHAAIVPGADNWECDSCRYAWGPRKRRKALVITLALGPGTAASVHALAEKISVLVFCDACLHAPLDLFRSLHDAVIKGVDV